MNTVISKVRNLIEDNIKTDGRDAWTYESIATSKIITLTQSNISATTIIVQKNGIVWSDTNYTFSSDTGKLTITGTLAVGDSLEITYSYYEKYSDSEIKGFIKAAISYLSVEKYKTFAVKSDDVIFPTPVEAEENLIALIANLLIRGDVVSYRTPEITIVFNRGDSKEKKIKKTIRQFKKCLGVLSYIDLGEKIEERENGVTF